KRQYRYGFVMWESGEGKSPEAVLQAHGFKWAKGQHFSEEVSDMELRHPVCLELTAAQAF
ncbi:MAG: hypothetical protein N3G20_00780, partial [Verrucomicrobiae bacterium]|nr:hypothetical protein [Verrucomicrobiae bacterium]